MEATVAGTMPRGEASTATPVALALLEGGDGGEVAKEPCWVRAGFPYQCKQAVDIQQCRYPSFGPRSLQSQRGTKGQEDLSLDVSLKQQDAVRKYVFRHVPQENEWNEMRTCAPIKCPI